MSDVFDTYEASFLKNIKTVQRILQQKTANSSKYDEMSESISDATQDVQMYRSQLSKMQAEYGMCQDPTMKTKVRMSL